MKQRLTTAAAGVPGMLAALLFLILPARAEASEGFGAATAGGVGKPLCHVTTLADSGPGSLRQCAGPGNAYVVFQVAGDILLQTSIRVGSFVTIDGSTAPAPGVTLRGAGILINGTHDVIVKHVRVRDALAAPSMDCIQVRAGATRVLIDRVSTSDCADGSIDVTGDPANLSGPATRDVTIRDSIIGPPITGKKAMLIKYNATRISLLRNLFVHVASRAPEVSRELVGPDPGTTVQMVNNVVWDWGPGYATRIHFGATGNVEANFYADPSGSANDRAQGLVVCTGRQAPSRPAYALCGGGQVAGVQAWAYTHGNVSQDGVNLDAAGNVQTAFPAPAVSVMDACAAARHVVTTAGVRPLDAVDASLVGLVRISTATCGAPTPPPPPTRTVGNPPAPPPPSVTPPPPGPSSNQAAVNAYLRQARRAEAALIARQQSELKALDAQCLKDRQAAAGNPAALKAVNRQCQQQRTRLLAQHRRQLAAHDAQVAQHVQQLLQAAGG